MTKPPLTGLIYRQDGAFAQFSVSLNLQPDGQVRYEVLGEPYSTRHFTPDPDTVIHWGRICYHSLRHELFAEVGPVGQAAGLPLRGAHRFAGREARRGDARGPAPRRGAGWPALRRRHSSAELARRESGHSDSPGSGGGVAHCQGAGAGGVRAGRLQRGRPIL